MGRFVRRMSERVIELSGWISSKTVKTRKEHSCFGCNEKILKGATAEATTFRNDDNEIRTVYECQECRFYQLKECHRCVDKECQDAWDGTMEEGYKAQCRLNREEGSDEDC